MSGGRIASITVLFAALVAGCGGGVTDPCVGQSGACVGVVLTGDVGKLDSVHIDMTGAVNHSFTAPVPNSSFA